MGNRVLDLFDAAHGQCRLSVVSGTSLKLAPFNGQNLNIGGNVEQVPSAGVTIANTGLGASTLHFVYAFMSAGVMTLELSATGHSQHTNGVEIKTGDATRTLVGMIRTDASTPGQFVDSDTAGRLCLNWFNRRDLAAQSPTSTVGSITTTAATPPEIATTMRAPFLIWAGEVVEIQLTGNTTSATALAAHTTSAGVDATAAGAPMISSIAVANAIAPAVARYLGPASEGYHFASAHGRVSSGTGVWTIITQVRTRG